MISYVICNRLGHLLIDYNTECDNKDNNNKKEMYVSKKKKQNKTKKKCITINFTNERVKKLIITLR